MGSVISFSNAPKYLDQVVAAGSFKSTILDTNVLIAASYDDTKEDYEVVPGLLKNLESRNSQFFATVNTKAEFLEFHRRLILTENLLDAVDEFSKLKLPKAVRAKIQSLKGTLNSSIDTDKEKNAVFNHQQIKKIKKEFSAGSHSGHLGWLALCDLFLKNRMAEVEKELSDLGVTYISQNEITDKDIFHTKIDWAGAFRISEKTGPSFSDAMILNAFQCSHCPFIVSMDFLYCLCRSCRLNHERCDST
ncbi:MAG: hypothetical protein WCG27_07125 [Pseudomonadota bacterium]